MSNRFWQRLSNLTGLFAITGVFGLVIFVANLEIKDLDLWLHIGVGRYIVQHGFQVPAVDILSCTIAGQPWVNHEWLFQVIVYYIHTLFGPDGLITMQVVLVTFTMVILFILGYNRDKQLPMAFALLLVALVYKDRFTIRPDLYSLLFFAIYILVLSFHLDRKRAVWILFIVQVLWSNIHGFFFFGPLFALIGLSAEWIKRHVPLPYEWNKVGRLTDDEYRRMKVILGVVILACFVNPLGYAGAWYPIRILFEISGESKIFFSKIVELQRPITRDTLFSLEPYPFYRLLLIMSALSFFFNRRKIDIGGLLFWLVFLYFSLVAVRNLIFFGFAAYLVFVTNVLSLRLKDIVPMRFTDPKFLHVMEIGLKVFIILWIMQYGSAISLNGYFDFDKYERKSEFGGVSQRNFPNKAVDFMVANNVRGNFYNDFNSGAYLVGRMHPNIKVFIDGRTEVYGPKFFHRYLDIWDGDSPEEFQKVLDEFNMTGALLDTVNSQVPPKILNYMYKHQDWAPVYFNYDGLIFLKRVDMNRELIEKFELDLKGPPVERMDLYRLGARIVTPYQNISRAYTLETIDADEAALAEINEALTIFPNFVDPYKLLGKIYAKREDYQKAFENFRIAVMFLPHDQRLRYNMAQAYYDLQQYKYAAKEYGKIIQRWPSEVRAHYLQARALAKEGEYSPIVDVLRQAIAKEAGHAREVLDIGQIAQEQGNPNAALMIDQVALESGTDQGDVYATIGKLHEELGQLDEARQAYEKGLQADAEHEELNELLENLKTVSPAP